MGGGWGPETAGGLGGRGRWGRESRVPTSSFGPLRSKGPWLEAPMGSWELTRPQGNCPQGQKALLHDRG